MTSSFSVQGAGLGLRRSFIAAAVDQLPEQVDFMEVAPENWIDVGGRYGHFFEKIIEKMPMVCHGLSLNLGGSAPLDEAFIRRVGQFIQQHTIRCYSEHLSYCADEGHLYDLMPIPFTQDAIKHVVDRINQVQDIIGQRMAIENVSYYAAPGKMMDEIDFINTILEKADCALLLDVNNIYVNSINHQYDAEEFLKALPGKRIAYAHIAGHYEEAEDLRVDTHGADVVDPVWDLLQKAYEYFGVFPTLLERDFNIPALNKLVLEVDKIKSIQEPFAAVENGRKQQNA